MSTERVLAEILTLILEASNTDILFPQIPLPWLSCFPTSFHFYVCSSSAQLCLASSDLLLKTEGAQGPRPQLSSPLWSPG